MRVLLCSLISLSLGCNLVDPAPATMGSPTCDPGCGVGTECALDDDDAAVCVCAPGHTGADCQMCSQGFAKTAAGVCVADPCDERSCNGPNQLSNTCEPLPSGDFKCACAPGFSGDKCDQAESGCALDPCQNDGVCSADDQGETSCACIGGFTGDLCDACPEGFDDACMACLPGRFGADCSQNCADAMAAPFTRMDAIARVPFFVTNNTNQENGLAASQAKPGLTLELTLMDGTSPESIAFHAADGTALPHIPHPNNLIGMGAQKVLVRLTRPIAAKSTESIFIYIGVPPAGAVTPASDVINGTEGWAIDAAGVPLVGPVKTERFLSVQMRQISPGEVEVVVHDNSDDPNALGSIRIDDQENDLPKETIKQYANLTMGSEANPIDIDDTFPILNDTFSVTLSARESTRLGLIFGEDVTTVGDPVGLQMQSRMFSRTAPQPGGAQISLCPEQAKP